MAFTFGWTPTPIHVEIDLLQPCELELLAIVRYNPTFPCPHKPPEQVLLSHENPAIESKIDSCNPCRLIAENNEMKSHIAFYTNTIAKGPQRVENATQGIKKI